MAGSRVHGRYYFLKELGAASARMRKITIDNMIPQQMDAISVVARYIVESRIPIMDRDSDYFQQIRRLLRAIAGHTIPFRRKRRLLLRYHKILPRLLREFYLRHTIRVEIRRGEE